MSGDNENLNELMIPDNVRQLRANIENHELSSEDSPFTLSLRREEFEEEKEMKRFIKTCESIIRKSPEYKIWTNYIRDSIGIVKCALTNERHGHVTCDIHHHPVSLYTIVRGIIIDYLIKGDDFCCLDVAIKILELHYENRVGYISIIRSLHEKFHNGFLNLPMELVMGDYKHFMDNYYVNLSDEEKDIIDSRLAINLGNCGYGNSYNWGNNNYIAVNQ